MLKINLGSGPDSAKGWENIDWGWLPWLGAFKINKVLVKFGFLGKEYGVDWPKITFGDIRKSLLYEDKSVNFIYCSNVLEHLNYWETAGVVKESFRILKKNGVLRVVMPDLDILIKNYSDPDVFNNEYLGYEKKRFKTFKEKILEKFIRPHQWMFNEKSFRKVLSDGGFREIKFYKIGKGECPDLKKLDLPIHKDLCFYVEAKK
ncbi:MAG: methyltransferase domain-containing protein [Patescibacteria group bacterium]